MPLIIVWEGVASLRSAVSLRSAPCRDRRGVAPVRFRARHLPVAVAVLLALIASSALSRAQPIPEHKSEFTSAAEARAAGWAEIRGNASKLAGPELSVVGDAAVGKTSLRVEVRQQALWQGIVLHDTLDLSDYAGMEFQVKQNVHTQGEQWPLVVQVFFEGEGSAIATPGMGLGGWTKITLPFSDEHWQFSNQPQGFAKTLRLRFYPYRHLDTPGEFLQLDGLRFLPRSEAAERPDAGLSYQYETLPADDADRERTMLSDGQVGPDAQVTFPAYGSPPVIVLDLGSERTLTSVALQAVAAPAANIASARIAVSGDREQWTDAGLIENASRDQAVRLQTLTAACFGIGQYVRLTLERPRVDVPLLIGEISLDHRDVTDADRERGERPYFDGPELPEVPADLRDNEHYIVLGGASIRVAVHRQTGVVAGLWGDRGQQILLRGWDRYILENRDTLIESAEYADSCQLSARDERRLELSGVNGDLEQVRMVKHFRIQTNDREEWLEKETRFIYGGSRPDCFVTLLGNVAIAQAFRQGGYYEGAQVRCDRVGADDVAFKRVIPSSKSVMLIHPSTGETLTQYRYKVNGRFCFPYYTQAAQESYNTTSYNRHGWEIGSATLKLAPGVPASVQIHTARLADGRFGWDRHLLSLPECRSYMARVQRPEWLSEVKAIVLNTYRCVLRGRAERNACRLLSVLDDGYVIAPGLTHADGVWGELPVSGEVTDLFGGITPADELCRMFESLRELPRYKAGLYMWLQSVNRDAPVFKTHPDWFITTNKSGGTQVIFPALKPNFGRILSAPGHVDFLLDQVEAFHRRYPQDCWYVDGGSGSVNLIDWTTLRTSHDYDGMDFCRRMRERFKAINPEGILFFNESSDRVADIGFAEIGRHFGKEWRRAAARMHSMKVRQAFDPWRLVSPLYWVGDGNRYLRICIGLGLPPSGTPSLESEDLLAYAPYCSAAFETRGFQHSPTRVRPSWREDADTEVEMHALRAGSALVLSVIEHGKRSARRELHAQIPDDLAGPGSRVVVIHHVLKDIGTYRVPVSDRVSKAVYRQSGWATGAVTELRNVETTTVDERGWIRVDAELQPGLLTEFVVTHVPAYYWSRDGLRANVLLPAIRRHRIDAGPADDAWRLSVSPDDVPREVLVLAPEGSAVSSVLRDGRPTAGNEVLIHGMHGAIVGVEPSTTPVRLECRFGPAMAMSEAFEADVPTQATAGSDLSATVQAPANGRIYCNLWRDGTLVLATSRPPDAGNVALLTFAVPEQAHNGAYVLELAQDTHAAVRKTLTVTGYRSADSVPPRSPPTDDVSNVSSFSKDLGQNVKAVNTAMASYGGSTPSVDRERLMLKAEIGADTQSYYNSCFAALEFTGLRRAALHVDHNMFPARGLYPERNILYEKHADAFIGFFVDYGTAGGYTKRVAFSLGKMNPKRQSSRPDWGKAAAPDRYIRLPSTVLTGEELSGGLDFERWAPSGWDSRIWLTVVLDKVLRSRWLSLQLLAPNPEPATLQAIPATDASEILLALKRRSVRALPCSASPVLDGRLDGRMWQDAEPSAGFFVVGESGLPASQRTQVQAGYDTGFVYIGLTCWEQAKTGFDTTSGATGRPWFDDGIEFAVAPPAWQGTFLHGIVSADGVTFLETSTDLHDKHKKSVIPVQVATHKEPHCFTVEIAVPVGNHGVPAPMQGETWQAQFMRNRVAPSGAREYTAWSPTDGYHHLQRFGRIEFQ